MAKKFYDIVRAITIAAFFMNSVILPESPASAWIPDHVEYADTDGVKHTMLSEFDPNAFDLPLNLGRITGKYKAEGGSQAVVHIQDAHCNYDCQKKIAEIISFFNEKYGSSVINLEGGVREYDLSVFEAINDTGTRKMVGDYFVREGILSGAEYYAAVYPGRSFLWGVEDADLYLGNLDSYKRSIRNRPAAEMHLSFLNSNLAELKKGIYSKELLEFDRLVTSYAANSIDLNEYVIRLKSASEEVDIDIAVYPDLYLFLELLDLEKSVDFRRADIQRNDLIERIRERSSLNAVESFAMDILKYSEGKTSHRDFYEDLIYRAEDRGIDTGEFGELNKYIEYINIYEGIDKIALFNDAVLLADNIISILCRNDDQRELAVLSRTLRALESIFAFKLTLDDYLHYRNNKELFSVSNFTSFMQRHSYLLGSALGYAENIRELDIFLSDITEFYNFSFKRDESFVENMIMIRPEELKTSGHKGISIIVTGGFHTENLNRLFRENGISYLSILPSFRNDTEYESPYFEILAGKKTDLLSSLDSALYGLQVPSLFNAIGGIVDQRAGELSRIGVLALAYALELERSGSAGIDGYAFRILRNGKEGFVFTRKEGEQYVFDFSENIDTSRFHIVTSEDEAIENTDTRSILEALARIGHDRTVKSAEHERVSPDIAGTVRGWISEMNDQFLAEELDRLLDPLETRTVEGEGGVTVEKSFLVSVVGGLKAARAGGQGIYLPSGLSDIETARALLHELLAGIYGNSAGSHDLIETVVEQVSGVQSHLDPEVYSRLRASAFMDDFGNITPVWRMTETERSRIDRDWAETAIGLPSREEIEKSKESHEYNDGQGFIGVDLDHYVHAQKTLRRLLSGDLDGKDITLMQKIISELNIDVSYNDVNLSGKIYSALIAKGYSKKIIDIINGYEKDVSKGTYESPSLEDAIGYQSKEARIQSVYEAVSNSIDALSDDMIGQFGKGIKQALKWMEDTGGDKIDVLTKEKDGRALKLTIVRAGNGQYYIQISQIDEKEYSDASGRYSEGNIDNGTIFRIALKNPIPPLRLGATDPDITQENIIDGIRSRYPFLRDIGIYTRSEVSGWELVNGHDTSVIVGDHDKFEKKDEGRRIYVHFNGGEIAISDNGSGMAEAVLSRMFVPGVSGGKGPAVLSPEEAERKLEDILVVHDRSHIKNMGRVSFARNREVIEYIDMPDDLIPSSVLRGNLMLDMGPLVEVGESRADIKMRENFRKGLVQAVRKIAEGDLDPSDKIRFINSIVTAMETMIRENPQYIRLFDKAVTDIRKAIAPLIDDLENEGFFPLPNHKEYIKFQLPEEKKPLYVHERIFNWKGVHALKESGGVSIGTVTRNVTIEGRTVPEVLEIISFPFSQDAELSLRDPIEMVKRYVQGEKFGGAVKGRGFIAIPESLGRVIAGLQKKSKIRDLTSAEKDLWEMCQERIKIMVAEKVDTLGRATKLDEEKLKLTVVEFSGETGEIDREAIYRLLNSKPDILVPEDDSKPYTPDDANAVLVERDGNFVDLFSREEVLELKQKGYTLEHLAHNLYLLCRDNTYRVIRFEKDRRDSKGYLYMSMVFSKKNKPVISHGGDYIAVLQKDGKEIYFHKTDRNIIADPSSIARIKWGNENVELEVIPGTDLVTCTDHNTWNVFHMKTGERIVSPWGNDVKFVSGGTGLQVFEDVENHGLFIRDSRTTPIARNLSLWWEHSKNFKIAMLDPSGMYAVCETVSGDMHYYEIFRGLSESKLKEITASGYISTVWHDGEFLTGIASETSEGTIDVVYFNKDGENVKIFGTPKAEVRYRIREGSMVEILCIDGEEKYTSQTPGAFKTTESGFVDNTSGRIYDLKRGRSILKYNTFMAKAISRQIPSLEAKHYDKIEFFIDRTGETVYEVITTEKGEVIIHEADITEENYDQQGSFFSKSGNEIFRHYNLDKTASTHKTHQVTERIEDDSYVLYYYESEEREGKISIAVFSKKDKTMDIIDTEIDASAHNFKSFDGKYMLFVEKDGEEFVYFDITQRKAASSEKDESSLISFEKPGDIPEKLLALTSFHPEGKDIFRLRADGTISERKNSCNKALPFSDGSFISYVHSDQSISLVTLENEFPLVGESGSILTTQDVGNRQVRLTEAKGNFVVMEVGGTSYLVHISIKRDAEGKEFMESRVLDSGETEFQISFSGDFAAGKEIYNKRICLYKKDHQEPVKTYLGISSFRMDEKKDRLINKGMGKTVIIDLNDLDSEVSFSSPFHHDEHFFINKSPSGYEVVKTSDGFPLSTDHYSVVKVYYEDEGISLMLENAVEGQGRLAFRSLGNGEFVEIEKSDLPKDGYCVTHEHLGVFEMGGAHKIYLSELKDGIEGEKTQVYDVEITGKRAIFKPSLSPSPALTFASLGNKQSFSFPVLSDHVGRLVGFLKGDQVVFYKYRQGLHSYAGWKVLSDQNFSLDLQSDHQNIYVNSSKTVILLPDGSFLYVDETGKPTKGDWKEKIREVSLRDERAPDPTSESLNEFRLVGTEGDHFLFLVRSKHLMYVHSDFFISKEMSRVRKDQEERTLKKWSEKVVPKLQDRANFCQPSYMRLADIARGVLEDQYNSLVPVFSGAIDILLNSREISAINETFRNDLENDEIEWPREFPSDRFAHKAYIIAQGLEEFLRSTIEDLSGEDNAFVQEYYKNLFSGIMEILLNDEISLGEDIFSTDETKQFSNTEGFALLSALSLGWLPSRQEEVRDIGDIAALLKAFRYGMEGEKASLPVSMKFAEFISSISQHSSEKHTTMVAQARKIRNIIDASPVTAEKLMDRMRKAFKEGSLDNEKLSGCIDTGIYNGLGDARPFAVFFTNDTPLVREGGDRKIPTGEDVKMPKGGISITQIVTLLTSGKWRKESDTPDDQDIMSIDDLISHINSMPEMTKEMEQDESRILNDMRTQRESGAYAGEIIQNSRDATKNMRDGKLIVDFYMQNNGNVSEYVEEARDNGTGALKELALLIPMSTKKDAVQKDTAGFFGTGKFTIFDGVDRVEMVTNNENRAFMFTFTVDRDKNGEIRKVRLTGIRKINAQDVERGVTIRRIKETEKTIPELDMLISQRLWKTFGGCSQLYGSNARGRNFRIFLKDHDAKENPLEVDHQNPDGETSLLDIEKDFLSEIVFTPAYENSDADLLSVLEDISSKGLENLEINDIQDLKQYLVNKSQGRSYSSDDVNDLMDMADISDARGIDNIFETVLGIARDRRPMLRLIGAEDMPRQVLDRAGLRVCQIKEEYLELIPGSLKKNIEELGIMIQIPLQLIRERNDFKDWGRFKEYVKKYIAMEFYKLLAYQALKHDRIFEGFPSQDWEAHSRYAIKDPAILTLASRISKGQYENITYEELLSLLPRKGKIDHGQRFVMLMLALEFPTGKMNEDGTPEMDGLLIRRMAVQRAIGSALAQTQGRRMEAAGLSNQERGVQQYPNYQGMLELAEIYKSSDQYNWRDKIIDPADYDQDDREVLELALPIARFVGLKKIHIVAGRAPFLGLFSFYDGEPTMVLSRNFTYKKMPDGRINKADVVNTITHELAHFMEALYREHGNFDQVLIQGVMTDIAPSGFTHAPIGPFAEAMKYLAAAWQRIVSEGGTDIEVTDLAKLNEEIESLLRAPAPDPGVSAVPPGMGGIGIATAEGLIPGMMSLLKKGSPLEYIHREAILTLLPGSQEQLPEDIRNILEAIPEGEISELTEMARKWQGGGLPGDRKSEDLEWAISQTARTEALGIGSMLDELLPLFQRANYHDDLKFAMAVLLDNEQSVASILQAIDLLPETHKKERSGLEEALRAAAAEEGFKDVDPLWGYVVGQVVSITRASRTNRITGIAARRLSLGDKRVQARSVLVEADINGGISEGTYKSLIESVLAQTIDIKAQKEIRGSKGLLKIPFKDREVFEKARKTVESEGKDLSDIKVQFIDQHFDQEETHDTLSQFKWGVMVLDHTIQVEEAREAGKEHLPAPGRGLLWLTQAMIRGLTIGDEVTHIDAETILKNLFNPDSFIVIRKVDWESFRDQLRAWEAIATSL